MDATSTPTARRSGIAVIGMACRLPGAANPETFWRNLCAGVESIRPLSRDEILKAGADPADLDNPHHVAAGALLDRIEEFDAAFFGFTAREAEVMDPQHRLFLECSWEALENAGYDPARYDGAIGVFGGGIFDSYVTVNLMPAGVFDDKPALLQTVLANEKDYMTTRVSYKLNLRGPSYNVQSGCSTSLVAIHLACQNLLNFESDMALAGGVAIDVSRSRGYWAHPGSVHSPDGHCRAFDEQAAGTVFGNGAGIVVLKRLEDAIADGDRIYAVVAGSATNNDGSLKVGFTAPSLVGQSKVIAEAMADAGVTPDTIGYVEAHGTGTALGDPIELEAMTKAFASHRVPSRSCAIGSVKTNIGHLDAAAGVSGFIKAVLALSNRQIPPTLHFERPNPKVALADSPFYVAHRLIDWNAGTAPGVPRRAGVSSFGMGGTNAHVILEEAPVAETGGAANGAQLLVLSGRSRAALDAAAANLAARLKTAPATPLADVAYTLQTGRAVFAHRRAVACQDVEDAVAALEAADTRPAAEYHEHDGATRPIAFLFPGQGSQYLGMGRALHASEPLFRHHLDECFEIIQRSTGVDLRSVMFGLDGRADGAEQLTRTEHAQPALFVIEYALARLWMSRGVEPEVCIGHSVGEYVAACLADVFSLEDALQLVVARGRLMQSLPEGAMTAVPRSPAQLQSILNDRVTLAAVNAPSLCVVAGPIADIEALEIELGAGGVECRRLRTSHAFHSPMVEAILPAFRACVERVVRGRPRRPFISNVTGRLITDADAMDPDYWVRHLRQPVQFAEGVRTLALREAHHFVEVGPGRTLVGLVRLQVRDPNVLTLGGLPHGAGPEAEELSLLEAAGRLWLRGTGIDWSQMHQNRPRRRVALPTYPFERSRFWIDPKPPDADKERRRLARTKNEKTADWFYSSSWKPTPPARWLPGSGASIPGGVWLVFRDGGALSGFVCDDVKRRGARVVSVEAGTGFSRTTPDAYTIRPGVREDYARLIGTLESSGTVPSRVVHLWQAGDAAPQLDATAAEAGQERGFYSVMWLAQALAPRTATDIAVTVITADAQEVVGGDLLRPERSTVAGPCLVIPQEYERLHCQWVDVQYDPQSARAVGASVASELAAETADRMVAYRGGRRWVPTFDKLTPHGNPAETLPRRQNGVYLVTGGLGHLGFSLAYYLASAAGARLVLVGRAVLPPRAEWPQWIATHDLSDAMSMRMHRVLALERAGAEVVVVRADAGDRDEMRRVVEETVSRFGSLDGVIAAAGVADGTAFAPINAVDQAMCEAQFRPKLRGLFALEDALGGRPLDFCMVVSSLSSLIGGPGYAVYAAANRFLDAFVHRHNQRAGEAAWVAVNWDAWQRDGLVPAGSALAHLALSVTEALEAFTYVLSARDLGQVIVSTADLDARVFEWTHQRQAGAAAPDERATYARPVDLEAGYEMPETPTELIIAEAWQQVLGIDRVGVNDTFLDLGGNSLSAIQVIGRLYDRLGVRISIEEFIFPTVRQLASVCDARLAAAPAPQAEPARPSWLQSVRKAVRHGLKTADMAPPR